MQPKRFNHLLLEPRRSDQAAGRLCSALFWITAAAYLAASAGFFYGPTRALDWPLCLLLIFAVAACCSSMARQLPSQNVFAAAAITALIGGAAHALGSFSGVPFGPCVYSQDMGRPLFGLLPWPLPLLWILFVLSSRGAARLVLRPWRRGKNYGFLLIALTAALVVLSAIGLDVFATQVFSFWKWSETKLHIDLLGAPIVNFIAWGLVSLLILAFATTFLINKRPGAPSPPDYYPLAIWVLTLMLFAAGAASRHLTTTAAVLALPALVVAALAVVGSRTRPR